MAEKQLDFTGGAEPDPDSLEIARRQQMAQAIAAAVMKAQGADNSYRKSPIAAVLDALSIRNAKGASDKASADQLALMRSRQAEEQSQLAALASAVGGSGDPRSAIAQALTSHYGNVRKMAEGYNKSGGENFRALLDKMPGRFTPESAIGSAGGGGYAGGLQVAPPPASPSLISATDPTGVMRPAWMNTDPDGKTHVHPITEPARINATATNGARKVGYDVLEQQGKFYAAGGKGFEQGQNLQKQLATTMDILRTLNENPMMGAGGEAFQTARKWTEALGGQPLQLTGTTEQMKAQLGQNVIQTLGGLGNQISDADRRAMAEALGSLDTDPAALRRLLLLSMKYQMRGLTKLESEAQALSQNPAMEGIDFPGYKASIEFPSTADANDFEMMLGNRLPVLRKPDGTIPQLGPQGGSRIRPR